MIIGCRLAAAAASLGVLGAAAIASAQAPPPLPAPQDPYAAPPAAAPRAAAPPTADAEIDDAVAASLIARARVLAADGAFEDAKQLVAEALVRSPQGPSSAAAGALLAELNAKLGIGDAPPLPPPMPLPPVLPPDPHVERSPELPAAPVSGWVTRYAGGVVGGAVAGGLFADVATGLDSTTSDDVTTGVVLGALGGGLLAYATDAPELTAGDHALIGSMTAWGLIGGLTIGLAMDPPTGEAYSLNGVLGIAGGYLIGHIAARRADVTPARMLRVDGLALIGAAAPWILYGLTSDDTSGTDEQVFGLLSTAGLVAGAYFGFRWTHDTDRPSRAAAEAAPVALFQRRHTGAWSVGGLGLGRVQGGAGASVALLSGRW